MSITDEKINTLTKEYHTLILKKEHKEITEEDFIIRENELLSLIAAKRNRLISEQVVDKEEAKEIPKKKKKQTMNKRPIKEKKKMVVGNMILFR